MLTSPRAVRKISCYAVLAEQGRLTAFPNRPPEKSGVELLTLRHAWRRWTSFRLGWAFSSLEVCLRPKSKIAARIAGPVIILCTLPGLASAQDATWLAVPSSGDFNNPDNWMPTALPEGPTGTATFDDLTIKMITFSRPQFPLPNTIGTLQFQVPGYILETTALDITGNGIQATLPNAPNLNFFNSGAVDFQGTSTAGPAKITAGIENDIDDFDGGFVMFHNNSTAEQRDDHGFWRLEH